MAATPAYQPSSVEEAADLVREATRQKRSFEIVGGGSKRRIGPLRATPSDVLSLGGLSAVVDYTPEELLLTVQPGARLTEIEALLASRGQRFAFEPPDLGPLLGQRPGLTTIGGVVAAGLSGSRRFKAGSVRDHVLAVQAINGRGEVFRAGGKVVKNVTGYDLPKLLTGSWGTLAVLTEITLKVMPAPKSVCTLLIGGLEVDSGAAALRSAASGSWEITGASWLPPTLAAKVPCPPSLRGMSLTAFRLEGVRASVAERTSALTKQLCSSITGGADHGSAPDRDAGVADPSTVLSLHDEESDAFWRAISDAAPLREANEHMIWRASVPFASGTVVLMNTLATIPGGRAFLDGAGGTVWFSLPPTLDGANTIRAIVTDSGGQALLVRAPAWLHEQVDAFQPLSPAVETLSRRLKYQFDPCGALNPRRMYREF